MYILEGIQTEICDVFFRILFLNHEIACKFVCCNRDFKKNEIGKKFDKILISIYKGNGEYQIAKGHGKNFFLDEKIILFANGLS